MIDLTDRQQLIDYLKMHRLWLDKKSGQHFLIDKSILHQIVAAAQLTPNDRVLEIGPGVGVLTHELAQAIPDGLLLAVERDQRLVDVLRDEFKGWDQVKVVHEDILRFPLVSMAENGPYHVVANLPYQISGAVVRKLFDLTSVATPVSVVIMLQREVVDRLLAKPGSSDRGVVTIITELFGEAERVLDVSADRFFPVPAVDSAVIRVVRHKEFFPEAEQIIRLAKAGFAAKRRTLENGLSATFRLPKETVGTYIARAQIDPMARAENLTIEDWQRLTQVFIENSKQS